MKLQKLIFLTREYLKKYLPNEEYYSFKPYLYGPFSKEVLYDIEFLVLQGFIEIDEEFIEKSDEEISIPVYRLTKAGKEEAKRLYEQLCKTSPLRT